MQRFFGKKRDAGPPVSLDDAAASMETRGTGLEAKIRKLDQELNGHKKALAQAKTPGAKQLIKQKAMRVLKQKRMLEKQLETMQGQQMNIDQTRLTQAGLQDSVTMVQAMKVANKQLKKQMKEIKIGDVEDLRDDMEELMEDAEAMNEVLGQTFGVPEDINENDLLNELDALDDEIAQEQDQVPDYLSDALRLPTETSTKPAESKPQAEAAISGGPSA